MKFLILIALLTFFTGANKAQAQMKLKISPSDSKYAKMSIDCQDEAKCDKKLVSWIDKATFFKGEWKAEEEGSIVSKTSKNMENENVTLHFHPSNFSVQLVDMTAEIAEREAAKAAKKAKRQALKSKSLKKKSSESVGEWRDRVAEALDEILKDLGEE